MWPDGWLRSCRCRFFYIHVHCVCLIKMSFPARRLMYFYPSTEKSKYRLTFMCIIIQRIEDRPNRIDAVWYLFQPIETWWIIVRIIHNTQEYELCHTLLSVLCYFCHHRRLRHYCPMLASLYIGMILEWTRTVHHKHFNIFCCHLKIERKISRAHKTTKKWTLKGNLLLIFGHNFKTLQHVFLFFVQIFMIHSTVIAAVVAVAAIAAIATSIK